MGRSDVTATTHKERVSPKVVSHIEVHPNMKGGHDVHTVHTHSYDHPPVVKEHEGPHDAVEIPKGHVLHTVAKAMGIPTKVGEVAAGSEENQDEKESHEI